MKKREIETIRRIWNESIGICHDLSGIVCESNENERENMLKIYEEGIKFSNRLRDFYLEIKNKYTDEKFLPPPSYLKGRFTAIRKIPK